MISLIIHRILPSLNQNPESQIQKLTMAYSNTASLSTLVRSRTWAMTETLINDVKIVSWPPRTPHFLVSGPLYGSTAIVIFSPQAAILANIAPLSLGTNNTGTETGPEHIRQMLNSLCDVFSAHRDVLDPQTCKAWVIAGFWKDRPVMREGILLIKSALAQMGLTTPRWKSYQITPLGARPGEGAIIVVVQGPRQGWMPKVHIESSTRL